jgi:arsenate reductase
MPAKEVTIDHNPRRSKSRRPRELLRSREAEFRAEGVDEAARSQQRPSTAMADHPILLERPIVGVGEKAALRRPPEAILALL